jgi:hypothetical protein
VTKSTARSLATTVTTTTGAVGINEKTEIRHSITPSFYYSSEIADGLNLGFSASLPVGIIVGTDTTDWKWSQITKTEYNNAALKALNNRVENVSSHNDGLTETTEFSIGLNAAVGASYALIPGRFTVNAGIGITPVDFTSTTTKFSRGSINETNTYKTYDADGKLTGETVTFQYYDADTDTVTKPVTSDQVEDKVTVTNTWEACTAVAAAGFTFNLGDNVALDMSVYARSNYTDFDQQNSTLKNSNSNGFNLELTNVQVLFSFKF